MTRLWALALILAIGAAHLWAPLPGASARGSAIHSSADRFVADFVPEPGSSGLRLNSLARLAWDQSRRPRTVQPNVWTSPLTIDSRVDIARRLGRHVPRMGDDDPAPSRLPSAV